MSLQLGSRLRLPPTREKLQTMRRIPKYSSFILKKLCNKQTLIFLFFLSLSTAFWFLQVLNEVHEEEFDLRIDQKNLPKGIVITSDLPASLRVSIKDRGATLLNYKYNRTLPDLTLDPSLFTAQEGHIRILTSELVKQIRPSLSASSQITSIKPDTLDIYYNHGRSKRVPVRLLGDISTANGYTIIGKECLTPDSATVFATQAVLDTISAVYIRAALLPAFKNSSSIVANLHAIRGVKITPSRVKISFVVDRLVEKRLTVPIGSIHVPERQLLRTFPSQTEVIFQVPMSLYRSIQPSHFTVVADHSQASPNEDTPESAKCRLVVLKYPSVVSHVRLAENEVEYILEKTN